MKKKVVKRGSKPNKDKVIAIAGAASKRNKREKKASSKSKAFRSRFLENLTAKRQEVEESLERLAKSQKAYQGINSAHDFREEVDQADREISAQTHYNLLERKHKELKKIESLIHRSLEDEEFGRCEECGKRIPDERLLIVPEATRCVPCQQEMEKWDSRGGEAEISYPSSLIKKKPEWGPSEDFDDEVKISLQTDTEYLSFVHLGETDSGESGGKKSDK